MKECIRIDRNLHVQLQCDGKPIPLPLWFIHGYNAKLARFSMLDNFPKYIQNLMEEQSYSILKELQKKKKEKKKTTLQRGHYSFSAELIRYALLLCCTSKQVSITIFFFIRENSNFRLYHKKLIKRFQCEMCSLIMCVIMLQRSSILTYFFEEDIRFHLAKWQSLFVLVLLYFIMQMDILQDIMNPQ